MALHDQDRSRRLGEILENANRYEDSRRRRSKFSSMLWSLLVVLILIGMFYAGRVWYSQPTIGGKAAAHESSQPVVPSEEIVEQVEVVEEVQPAATPALRSERIEDRRLLSAAPAPTGAPKDVQDPSLPEEVELTAAAELRVMRGGKVVGVIYLKPGDKVRPTKRDGGKLMVRWKDAEGTVLVSQTTLNQGD